MGAAAERNEDQTSTEYQRPDAAKAFEIYTKQIKPKKTQLETIRGDLSQPYDVIKEHAHFPRKVLDFIVSIEDLEDTKRDHFLLALSEGLKHRRLYLPRDLVTMADGDEGGPIVPTGDRPGLKLATIDGDDFEASEDELAAQRNRPSTEAAKAQADADADAEEEDLQDAAE